MAKIDELFASQLAKAEKRYADRMSTVKSRAKNLTPEGDWRKVEDSGRVWRRMVSLGMKEMAGTILASDTPAAPVRSAVKPDAEVNLLERIIEENDLLASRFLHLGSVLARAVGRVLIRRGRSVAGYGTGFLISPRLLMTNNHVLPNSTTASRSSIEFDYYERADGTTSPTLIFDFDPESFFITDDDLDFAIVGVKVSSRWGTPLADRGWIPLVAESGKALIGEPVNVIQHPGGDPQQIAIRNNEVSDIVDDFLHYKADTQRGSSGSCVLNMQWELAALHHAGVPKRDNEDRILLHDGSPWDGGSQTADQIARIAKEGVRISSIVRFVRDTLGEEESVERQLFDQCFHQPPFPPPPCLEAPATPGWRTATEAERPGVEPSARPAPLTTYDIDDTTLDRLTPEEVARIIAETEDAALEITREAAAPGEVIVAEGDSWFDYSVAGLDIIDNLRRFFGYRIHNVAEAGDTLDNMAWGTEFRRRGWVRRRPPLEETLDAVQQYRPRVVLLSVGGNDVAGDEFSSYLNHKGSGLPPVRDAYVDYMLKTYFRRAFEYIFQRIWAIDDSVSIIFHGYGHAPPDGRGVIRIPFVDFQFIGPWLRPALTAKGYTERLERERIVHDLIDRYNEMLRAMARDDARGRLHFIDLRPVIRSGDWENELHLSNSAYRRVAAEFDRTIQPLL
jgi:V8-like Glu-specific endopeptidase